MAIRRQYLRPSARAYNSTAGSIAPSDGVEKGDKHPAGKPLEELDGQGVRLYKATVSAEEVTGMTDAPEYQPATLVLKPHISSILGNAYVVAGKELERLANTALERPLTKDELSRFRHMSDAVSKLAREEREQEKAESVGELSDEELAELVAEMSEKGFLPGQK